MNPALVMAPQGAIFLQMSYSDLTAPARYRTLQPVVFNSATRFGDLSNLADNRHNGGFFTSLPRHWCAHFSMAGHGGETFGSAGSKFRFANPVMCLPPPFGDGRQATQSNLEATMPKLMRRALRVLFPVSTILVSTLPTQAEAHALAALLTAQGRRAVFHRTAAGFAVEVVA